MLVLTVLVVTGLAFRDAGTTLVIRQPLEKPDAIVSLASHEWERLPAAAELAHATPSAVVVLTLPQPVTIANCHDCSGRLGRLERLGVPAGRVRILPLTRNGTYGEALAVLAFAHKTSIHRIVVVTSPYHTRRSLAAFRKIFDGSGIEVGVEPARESSALPERWWATPYDRAYVAYEWGAIVYYALRHGVAPWG